MASQLPSDPYLHTTEAGDLVGLTFLPLSELEAIDRVRDATAGAICSFIGTTRDSFEGKTVTKLEYEAYSSMAIKTMASIVQEARELSLQGSFSFDWPNYPSASTSRPTPPKSDLIQQTISIASIRKAVALTRISLVHRLGVVGPKESSIAICVSSPHRKEAFRAAEWILEEVKKRVEIWKREVYDTRDSEKVENKAWKENFPQTSA